MASPTPSPLRFSDAEGLRSSAQPSRAESSSSTGGEQTTATWPNKPEIKLLAEHQEKKRHLQKHHKHHARSFMELSSECAHWGISAEQGANQPCQMPAGSSDPSRSLAQKTAFTLVTRLQSRAGVQLARSKQAKRPQTCLRKTLRTQGSGSAPKPALLQLRQSSKFSLFLIFTD